MTVAAILISTLERRFRYDHCWRQVADWRICSIVARVQVPQIVNRGAVIDAKVHIWKEVGQVKILLLRARTIKQPGRKVFVTRP